MNISTLIKKLEELKDEHGGLEVGYYNDYDTRFVVIDQVWFKKSGHSNLKARVDVDDKELGGYFIAID